MCVFEDDDKYAKAILKTNAEVDKIKLEMVELRTYMKLMISVFSIVGAALVGVLVKLFAAV